MPRERKRRQIGAGGEAAAIALTAVANVAVNRFLPPSAYVPANLGAAGLLTWFARRAGASWSDMGMEPSKVRHGLRWGLLASIPIAAVVAAGVAHPATRRFFVDEEILSAGTGDVLYQTLVRIPLGTALAEEVLFRGALLGIFERRHSRRVADGLSGLMFGLWHVLPTLDQLGTNPAGEALAGTAAGRAGAVGGIVLVTVAAGYGFAWLRDRSESVVAPVIAHASLNGLAYLGGRLAASILRG